jgi:UDP-perosamine 4-acetyltransferase
MGVNQAVKVVIVGAGGHARVIVDTLLLRPDQFQLIGLTDTNLGKCGQTILGLPIMGGDDSWSRILAEGVGAAIVGIGENRHRGELADQLQECSFDLINAIHPTASISRHVQLGVGIAVMAGAVIGPGTLISDNVIVNTTASVDHDCVIERDAHVAPGAHLGGSVKVGRGALIGMGAAVLPNISIGEWAIVGAGAVVIRDVPPEVTAVGVPAGLLTTRS